MSLAIAITLGVLFAVGTYLILRRDVIRVVFGALILSQAANIYLIAMGGLGGKAPILGHHGTYGNITDPIPQALVLTAIVIGFATTAFILAVTYRLYEENETIDLETIKEELR